MAAVVVLIAGTNTGELFYSALMLLFLARGRASGT